MAVLREFIEDVKEHDTLLMFYIAKDRREDVTFTGKLISVDDYFFMIERYTWDRSVDEYVPTGKRQVIRTNTVYSVREMSGNSAYS